MMIETPKRDGSVPRILKVRLPTELCMRLHVMRIFQGARMSDVVEAALDQYFATHGARRSS